ncbi:RNA 2',3'-cyclic phosphodiesterase [Rossellomorea marisflavi]|uniref:RNA 2',3'-cyclic phosphodiesterase n=2 Tax=Rossellomorea marisflavi TaxID=189381 RepID=UPI0018CE5ADF|nr:RNA 2',3'-cyclic phosphodiesterase [Rossellomorea marisflavi]MCM2604741.1 RNA 2',3'-cyclic phosphodiesterase [Rossellomorea marisflavi]
MDIHQERTDDMRQPHYFFALPLPEEEKLRLADQAEAFPFKKPVHHQDFHLTLAFLGGSGEDALDLVKSKVRQVARVHEPFTLTFSDFDVFGRREAPRIFWMGVAPSDELTRLRAAVYGACLEAGYELDPRPFAPHITVARKWGGEYAFDERSPEIEPLHTEFPVEHVVLYRTRLEHIPKYEPVATFPLKGLTPGERGEPHGTAH